MPRMVCCLWAVLLSVTPVMAGATAPHFQSSVPAQGTVSLEQLPVQEVAVAEHFHPRRPQSPAPESLKPAETDAASRQSPASAAAASAPDAAPTDAAAATAPAGPSTEEAPAPAQKSASTAGSASVQAAPQTETQAVLPTAPQNASQPSSLQPSPQPSQTASPSASQTNITAGTGLQAGSQTGSRADAAPAAEAEMQNSGQTDTHSEAETAARPAPMRADNPEDAAARISGFTTPGVIEHLLQRPVPGEDQSSNSGHASIYITYPSLGHSAVDSDIRQWVTGIADAFEAHLDTATLGLLSDGEQAPGFELWGSYSVEWPSKAAVSVIFDIWNYAGGQQGTEDIMTLNYSLITGQRLSLVDIFEQPQRALELMSAWSRQALEQRFGSARVGQTLENGTAPLVENFSSLSFTSDGLRIHFQPYQVAPGGLGAQTVEIPLSALAEAGPLLALWGR